MSDVTFLSPSRLATYADCARKFDHEYVQEVSTPDDVALWRNQGIAYHEAIEVVCDETAPGDDAETIHDRALSAFDEKWAAHLDPDEYASRSHQEYQRVENRAAIDAFFDPDGGDGIEHARSSVGTEVWVEYVHDGRGLRGKVDNVLRTDEGLHLIDYKRNLRGVVSSYSASALEDHLAGEGHDASRVKNAFQTAVYVEGIQESSLYEPGELVRFSFYGLTNDTSFESSPSGYEVSVRGYPRETTAIYEEYHDTIWSLVERAHDGITTATYDPTPFDLVSEEACPDCAYRDACADYLAAEVRR